MRGKFFCLFIFSDSQPPGIIYAVQSFIDFFSIGKIPMVAHTKVLYKEFGIINNGYYLIRPDNYIGCRSQSLETETLENYLKINLEQLITI